MLLDGSQDLDWIYDLYQFGLADALEERSGLLFERMLSHIVSGFNADTGSLVLYQGEEEDKRLHIVAAIGLPQACVDSEISATDGVVGWVLTNRQALLLKGDVGNDSRFSAFVSKTDTSIPVEAMCWPLAIGSRLLGALCVNRFDQQTAFTEQQLESGRQIVNLITLVVDNIRLHGEQKRQIQQLAASNGRVFDANRRLQDALKRLNQAQKRLNDILDSLDSVVWSMEPGTLKMLYLNRAVFELSGRPVQDFFDAPYLWLNIIDAADRQRVEANLAELAPGGTQKISYRIHRPDGEVRWLSHHMRLVGEDADTPEHIDGISVDITQYTLAQDLLQQRNSELQKALDTVQEVQRQLLQSEKLSSIGQLAAGVAHEINNPIGYIHSNLGSLKTYVEDLLALLERYEAVEPSCSDVEQSRELQAFKQKIDLGFLKNDVLDLVQESLEGAFRVRKIVQDLKDFSHAGGDDAWQWANLNDCLDSTLNIVNNEVKYKATVVKEYQDIPLAWCLPHQLNQVIMNLLVNAAHAIEDNGTITIRSGADVDNIWIEVCDTGKGIAPDILGKIFDPFFTTKPVGKGTGLGLSVSYNIVKKHQGEIQVNSRVGEGSCFRVVLPRKV